MPYRLMCAIRKPFWPISYESARAFFPRPKILILNYPHNPTTTIVDQAFYREVVALAKRFHFHVISDFAYGDIVFDGNDVPSFLSVPGAIDVGCEFTTMSKGYNMAGWRVGFASGNREMLAALKSIKGLLRLRSLSGCAGCRDRRASSMASQVDSLRSRNTRCAAMCLSTP